MTEIKEGIEKAGSEQDARMQNESTQEDGTGRERMGLGAVIGSVLAAGLGVQSSRNRERDFREGRAVVFIIAGLLFTALFMGAVYSVVSLVLSTR